MNRKRKKFPHTYVIIFSIIIFSAVLTWIIPGGEFEREIIVVNRMEREVIKEGSFHFTESNPQTWEIFSSFFEGFVDKADIIVFILIIGGAFWVMNESRAIDVGIISFLKFSRKLEKYSLFSFFGVNNIIIGLVMLIFSIFGATFGMSEETIAFIIIFVPLAISMGYDSITGVAMSFVAAGLGFAGALLNPFTIGIAQGLSSLPLFSGIEYRFFCWLVINLVGIAWVLRYARKVKKDPAGSLVFKEDEYWRKKDREDIETLKYHTPRSAWYTYAALSAVLIIFAIRNLETSLKIGNSEFTLPVMPVLAGLFVVTGFLSARKSVHFLILNLLAFTLLYLIIGVMGYGWYIMEIATLFLAMGLFSGLSMGKNGDEITGLFLSGVKDIMSAALVVGLAGGILFILENGRVIDSLLYYMAKSMSDFGKTASIGMMYIFQTLINIVIPSGSAKAALTMPMMSQFSDLIGVSRQATVMAFQFGDGFTNMITPTSAVLMGVLGVARIPYDKWVKWIAPFMAVLIILGFLLLLPTVLMQLSGF